MHSDNTGEAGMAPQPKSEIATNIDIETPPDSPPNGSAEDRPLISEESDPIAEENQLTQVTLLDHPPDESQHLNPSIQIHPAGEVPPPPYVQVRDSNRRYSVSISGSQQWWGSGILKPEHGSKMGSSFHVGFVPGTAEEILPVPKNLCPQIMAAISVSLASMVIGIASAYSAPAIPSMNEANSTLWIELDGEEASWIGSLMPLGALVGGIIGAAPVEKLGRKRTIMATAIPFILSWLLIALASHIWMIYAARAIAGICIGLIGLTLPVYLAETVQPEVRGTLGLLPTTIGNTGILISYVAGKYLNFRNLAYLGAGLCVPYLICMKLIPETPRWYIANGKEAEGERSLQWFRGKGADIRTELHQIKTAHMISKKQDTHFKDLFRRDYLKLAFISLGLMFFQQFSGINAVIFYSTTIFKMTNSDIDEYLCTIIVGLVNMGAIFIALALIDRLGRKVLLLISDSFMIITLVILGGFFWATDVYGKDEVKPFGWIPLVSLMAFVVSFSLGFGPIPWIMMGEIFPTNIRGPAAAMTTAFNWTCTFLVTKSFPQIVAQFGAHSAFFGFAAICVVGIFFIIFIVPETQGQSLEDIEKNLARPFRRVSSTANLKPFPMST
jgi:facilitated trehalose transporter